MKIIDVKFKRIDEKFNDVALPGYATPASAGMDIRAALEEPVIIEAGKVAMIPTNLSVEIPEGYEIQVRPRSGLAAKYGIGVLNSPGTIDSDYRGEIKVILFNFGNENFAVANGERIAQIVFAEVIRADVKLANTLSDTIRGEGGFGSTGTN